MLLVDVRMSNRTIGTRGLLNLLTGAHHHHFRSFQMQEGGTHWSSPSRTVDISALRLAALLLTDLDLRLPAVAIGITGLTLIVRRCQMWALDAKVERIQPLRRIIHDTLDLSSLPQALPLDAGIPSSDIVSPATFDLELDVHARIPAARFSEEYEKPVLLAAVGL